MRRKNDTVDRNTGCLLSACSCYPNLAASILNVEGDAQGARAGPGQIVFEVGTDCSLCNTPQHFAADFAPDEIVSRNKTLFYVNVTKSF